MNSLFTFIAGGLIGGVIGGVAGGGFVMLLFASDTVHKIIQGDGAEPPEALPTLDTTNRWKH